MAPWLHPGSMAPPWLHGSTLAPWLYVSKIGSIIASLPHCLIASLPHSLPHCLIVHCLTGSLAHSWLILAHWLIGSFLAHSDRGTVALSWHCGTIVALWHYHGTVALSWHCGTIVALCLHLASPPPPCLPASTAQQTAPPHHRTINRTTAPLSAPLTIPSPTPEEQHRWLEKS